MAPAVTAALERVEMVLEQREADAGWSVHAQLPRNSSCGAVARRLVREYVQAHLDEEAAEDVLLVVSELSNNAFVHGEGSISLHVKRLPDRLRLEVRDEGKPRRIERRPESGDAGGGHGLFLVDRLSVAWGTTAGSGHVWSEIGVAGAPATA
jgi:anti-sigma regulatory factor (Ser/Thr protein kinase)